MSGRSAGILTRPYLLVLLTTLLLAPPVIQAAFPLTGNPAAGNSLAFDTGSAPVQGEGRTRVAPGTGEDYRAEHGGLSRQSIAALQVQLEEFLRVIYWRITILGINAAKVPHDLAAETDQLARSSGYTTIFSMLARLALVLLLAAAAELLLRRLVLRRVAWIDPAEPLNGFYRFWASTLQQLPALASLLVFILCSYAGYVLFYTNYFAGLCPLYLSAMWAIVTSRAFCLLVKIFLAPDNAGIRVLPMPDAKARAWYLSLAVFIWLWRCGGVVVKFLRHIGVEGDSLILMQIAYGTVVICAVGSIIWSMRKEVAASMLSGTHTSGYHWLVGQVASRWHLLVLLYLLLLWVFGVFRLLLVGPDFGLAFSMSLLILPLFFLLDAILGWGFRTVLDALREGEVREDGTASTGSMAIAGRVLLRLLLAASLGLWLLHVWGIDFSFTVLFSRAVRDVMLILVLGGGVWKAINLYLGHLMDAPARVEGGGDDEEDGDGADDGESEWGETALLNRQQTLLPLVRKFISVAMGVMLALMILSSMGVNIGPLLAGAGVIGIAIGFGAQKLVSDVLSGFFYLLDDAFRVGEYIEAGSIAGTVERITLRNIMLRHHRGMLQIIPYSDLGAITNYMRGGIVVKFNLQFPYDTDVEKVRKIIKRVGIAMLEHPEYGKNFIKQVKSQGIREVGDSVLTLRVKFTAKPGAHFVIRREAYRMITEALAAKGIHYAHRKVIVEVPQTGGGEETRAQDGQALAQAGAAAAIKQQAPAPA